MENNKIEVSRSESHARDHMANERTFLAWIRTSIGIMAFGFVFEKFAIFVRQISILLEKTHSTALPNSPHSLQGYSSTFGIFLVALGAIICLFAFVKYKKVEKQIKNNSYQSSFLLNAMLTLSVLLIGLFLIAYLNSSVFGI